MTTSTGNPTVTGLTTKPGGSLLPWISWGLEGLWLSAVFLVPLMFLGRDYAISEAVISYVEVPKVALLRTLSALMAVLWLVEWAIKSQALQGPFPSIPIDALLRNLRPSHVGLALKNWLTVHPIRWLLLAAWLFFGSTILSTVLSGSFTISMWGEIPGQDGYSAYSIASYGILFGVIATHLKSPAQLGRLLGAVVLMGFLVGLYGVLQHFGHDFFDLTESTGGGTARVTIFMGNTIFAGAVLAMTVPVTLLAASMFFQNENWRNWGLLSKLGQAGRDSAFTLLWASILAVQLLGLMFTFSRGPWSGAVLAMVVFLSVVGLSLGWKTLIRTALVLGLAGVLSVAFLHWKDNVSITDVGPWLSIVIALLGVAGTYAALFVINRFNQLIAFVGAVGVAAVIVVAAVLAPSALSGRGGDESTVASPADSSSASQVGERITSIKTNVFGGFVGGRGTHWKVSWTLIKDRPWFEFDDLSLSWLRPLIGYGPDLFRYTYLLESPPDAFGLLPLEPDHAHNFFIHQIVEQGIIGGLTSLALFVAVLGVVGHHLLRRRQSGNPMYRLLLFGLMAIIFGRFLEMMVGVARISDLTVLWVIFGLFGALIGFDDGHQNAPVPAVNQPPQNVSRRNRRAAARASTARSFSAGLVFRLAIVAWLVGGIGVVTWQKSINYVRASVAEGQALNHIQERDLESAVEKLDKAINLALGVPFYYDNRAQIFLAYQRRPEDFTEPGCASQVETPYLDCLAVQSLNSNLESASRQPFNYRARLAAGNSAFNLNLNDIALNFYADAASMVPNSWGIRNELAESQIGAGLYDRALEELDQSLSITGDSTHSSRALHLKGRALLELGRLDDAENTLKQGLSVGPTQPSLDLLRTINTAQGVLFDIDHFDRLINENPEDAVAYYFRGLAHLRQGNTESANLDIETSSGLGLQTNETIANLGYTRFKLDDVRASRDLNIALEIAPQNALFNAYVGELNMSQGSYFRAQNFLENAIQIDPDLGLPYLILGRIFIALGLEEFAKEAIDSSVELELPTALDYVNRGAIYGSFGEFDLALSDLAEAIHINPNLATVYNTRAEVHARKRDLESAIADFNTAIRIDASNSDYFINRGVVFDILGDVERSSDDFKTANSLSGIDAPPPNVRNVTYFASYNENIPSTVDTRVLLKLRNDAVAARDIEQYSAVKPEDHGYEQALHILARTYVESELWGEADKSLSQLIDLAATNPEVYRNRGDVYLELHRYEDALDDYHRAVLIDPLASDNFVARGKGFAEIGEYALARNDFNAAIRLNPDSSDAFKLRGYLSVQTGRADWRAFSDIGHAIEISPLDHDAYFKRSEAYMALGQTSLAYDDLRQAMKLAPTNTDYIYNLGLLRTELGDYDSALGNFNDALELAQGRTHLDPRHAKPLVELGRTYLRLGKPENTLGAADQALQLLAGNLVMPEFIYQRPAIILQVVDAYELLGDAFSELGRHEEAQVQYQLAADLR